MILVKSDPDLEARLAAMSDSQMKDQMAAMEAFNEELKKAGVMKDCDGLRPSREGKRVRFDGNLGFRLVAVVHAKGEGQGWARC